jgi:hypothetical protein
MMITMLKKDNSLLIAIKIWTKQKNMEKNIMQREFKSMM